MTTRNTITSWSFSRYKTYDQCPARAKYLYIDRMKEPGSPAMDRGSEIHKSAEDYTLGRVNRVPSALKPFEPFFKRVRALARSDPNNIVAETTWAFRKDWSQTTWDDWDGCWLRVKLDLAVVTPLAVEVIDHKTGKYSPQWNLQAYVEQVELYALASLYVYPELPAIPRLLFLDHGIEHPPATAPVVYAPSDRATLKKKWEARVKPMLRDRTFAPKPSSMCRFCSFAKSKGGPCEMN